VTRPAIRDALTRRDLLVGGAKALLGVGLLDLLTAGPAWADPADAPALAAPRPTAKNVIYLYMAGGMSHLDTLDPKPGSPTQGPVRAIPTGADGVLISEYLPRLAPLMKHVAVVRSLTSTQGAHEPGNYLMHTSYAQRGTVRHPALGAWLSHLSGRANGTLPANVAIAAGSQHPGAGFLESRFAPLPLGDPADGLPFSARPDGVDAARFARRMELRERLDAGFQQRFDQRQVRAHRDLYEEAVRLMGSKDLAAFDLGQEPEHLRDAYGEHQFGQGCLLARRLVEHDVRFVEVVLGGWDTHDDNFDRVQAQAAILDGALATLLQDLQARGLLDETLVVVATEFGRSPVINANQGRDHHPRAFSGLLAGGGIRGGRAWGATDERGHAVASDPVQIPDFNATIAYALGLATDQVVVAPNGRPFTIADKGRPLASLF
jgi:hypothetical protein